MRIRQSDIPVGFVAARDAARELGISDATLRTWIARGTVPARRLPGAFIVPQAAIDSLKQQQAVPA